MSRFTERWPDWEDFSPQVCRTLRNRWSVTPARLAFRAKVPPAALNEWEVSRGNAPDEFRRAVYLALRDLVLPQARLMVSILEALTDDAPSSRAPIPARVVGGQWVPHTAIVSGGVE